MSDAAKLKAFNIAAAKKHLSKKEIEDQRKKDEEVAAAQAYEEFVAIFEEPAKHGKTFVRGTTFNAGTREEKLSKETGKLYKPTSKLAELASTFTSTKSQRVEPSSSSSFEPREETRAEKLEKLKRKEKEKKKSNLELFKEELKIIQEEREERHRFKAQLKEVAKVTRFEPIEPTAAEEFKPQAYGSFDTGDPTTTNVYLGNINPKMTEQQLCEVFGKYGPLASVKVMWPRSEEEKARGRNCGFVAFMNRKDGERALKSLNGKEIMNYEMKLGWGKAVPIPPHPVYIPPALVELTLPPPPSGLPFNAQPDPRDKDLIKIPPSGTPFTADEMEKSEFETVLLNAVVKVVIPTDRNLLCLIHRMIEFVVREGPLFEAMIMNREINNPMFRFLFENQSPAHTYYRWKLFSILQGDSPSKWRTSEFQMFRGGSLWKPPPMNPYAQGMPEKLVDKPEGEQYNKKGQLSTSQRDRLEEMIRNLTPERIKVSDAMVYCIEHAEAAEEIIDCISESLTISQTAINKKIARLYLVSDILHNCSVKIANASYYRKGFQSKLPDIFKSMREMHVSIEGRLKAEQFKQKVIGCFRTWEDWAIYPNEYLIRLQNMFLGLLPSDGTSSRSSSSSEQRHHKSPSRDDIDGIPLSDTVDLDGVPLGDDRDDMDGVPMNSNVGNTKNSRMRSSPTPKYAPSKWETVDPNIIEAQAMTTSKWDLLDQQEDERDDPNKMDEDDLDGRPMDDDEDDDYNNGGYDDKTAEMKEREQTENKDLDFFKVTPEERRAKLREIELKVAKFQDELESGQRSRKQDLTISKQIEQYRQKLLRKEREKEECIDRRKDHRSPISADESSSHDKRSRHSSNSSSPPSRVRSRSRSPKGLQRSRSKTPIKRHQRSRSPRKISYRSRSRSPRKSRKSLSPLIRSRSRRSSSRSPGRRSHKSRKSKR